ncbi:hypothetical protein CLAIMM_01268 isoform 1, partial [Cladophialophora immunda]
MALLQQQSNTEDDMGKVQYQRYAPARTRGASRTASRNRPAATRTGYLVVTRARPTTCLVRSAVGNREEESPTNNEATAMLRLPNERRSAHPGLFILWSGACRPSTIICGGVFSAEGRWASILHATVGLLQKPIHSPHPTACPLESKVACRQNSERIISSTGILPSLGLL